MQPVASGGACTNRRSSLPGRLTVRFPVRGGGNTADPTRRSPSPRPRHRRRRISADLGVTSRRRAAGRDRRGIVGRGRHLVRPSPVRRRRGDPRRDDGGDADRPRPVEHVWSAGRVLVPLSACWSPPHSCRRSHDVAGEPWLGQFLVGGRIQDLRDNARYFTFGGGGDAGIYHDYALKYLDGTAKPSVSSENGVCRVRRRTPIRRHRGGQDHRILRIRPVGFIGSYLWYRATATAVPSSTGACTPRPCSSSRALPSGRRR